MKVKQVEVTNFGSYKHLQFDFSNQGLALIHGKTGSGKSTLQDVPCWILYGITAKDGNVDDIRSYKYLDEATTGTAIVETATGNITVHRIRGKSSENDLYWFESTSDTPRRGKDIADTQKLLEARLGVSKDLYLYGAYFTGFSISGRFFAAKAKERRELLETIANLELPSKLMEKTAEERKGLKAQIKKDELLVQNLNGKCDSLVQVVKIAEQNLAKWEQNKQNQLIELQVKSTNFEKEKEQKLQALQTRHDAFELQRSRQLDLLTKKLNDLDLKINKNVDHQENEVCSTCGSPNKEAIEQKINKAKLLERRDQVHHDIGRVNQEYNPFKDQFEPVNRQQNHYLVQHEAKSKEINPFQAQIFSYLESLVATESKYQEAKAGLDENKHKLSLLNTLYDLSFELRGELLKRSIKELNELTNKYLHDYFDAQIMVSIDTSGSDDVEVTIKVNGYESKYTQMSEGQHRLLKLCFSIAVMKLAANRSGIHFSTISFDEVIGNLDKDLVIQSFRLFESLSLEHETVLIIDHNVIFNSLFSNKYKVELLEDGSLITEDHE